MAVNTKYMDPNVIESLRNASRDLHDALPLLDAAERCGIDVSQLRQTHEEMRRQVEAFQANFFNGQTRP